MIERLRELNFSRLIEVDTPDPSHYTFYDYRQNGFKHSVKGFCSSCEKQGLNKAIEFPEYKLTNISHGAHSIDFIDSIKGKKPDTTDWRKAPVLFVFESPSLDYGIYEDSVCDGFHKRPSSQWYWVHYEREMAQYPEYFRGGCYGELVFSIIITFSLSNAYITNLVKCGMNNPAGDFKNLAYFPKECIHNCFDNFLKSEIEILKPEIIFTIGSKVHYWIEFFIKDQIPTYNLPHPAGRRGFKDEFYKTLYYWLVLKGLFEVKVINENDGQSLSKLFLVS